MTFKFSGYIDFGTLISYQLDFFCLGPPFLPHGPPKVKKVNFSLSTQSLQNQCVYQFEASDLISFKILLIGSVVFFSTPQNGFFGYFGTPPSVFELELSNFQNVFFEPWPKYCGKQNFDLGPQSFSFFFKNGNFF